MLLNLFSEDDARDNIRDSSKDNDKNNCQNQKNSSENTPHCQTHLPGSSDFVFHPDVIESMAKTLQNYNIADMEYRCGDVMIRMGRPTSSPLSAPGSASSASSFPHGQAHGQNSGPLTQNLFFSSGNGNGNGQHGQWESGVSMANQGPDQNVAHTQHPHGAMTSHEGPSPLLQQKAPSGEAVRSPMVGTVYLSPQPNAEPFVKVGDNVAKGQTLLIIEAMKVMNPVKALKGGVVSAIAVTNGNPVEYDEELIWIL